jgi:hypothetical protein
MYYECMKTKFPAPSERLTPEQFKALSRYKGWRYTELSVRWGVTPEWVSILARNPNRPIAYDDALHGLPNRHHERLDSARRAKVVTDAVNKASIQRSSKTTSPRGATKVHPGYRYRGYLQIGTIVTASEDIGSIAEEGMRGIVFQAVDMISQEKYGIIFETGLWDWFPPNYVDSFIVSSGIDAEGMASYQFTTELALQKDFETGTFEFWPTHQVDQPM